MRVLVTGGLGFVGYAVTHVLADTGHDVTVLTRNITDPPPLPDSVRLVSADLREYDQVERALAGREFDGVCHLAGLARVRDSFDKPLEYFRTNVGGTINLLQALAKQHLAPALILASTGAVYGSGASGEVDEHTPPHPDTPYASSKRAAEQLVLFQARTGTIGACVLRSFSISGTYNGKADGDDTRIITKALLVAAGHAPAVIINGDGNAMREFTHVLDVANGYRLAVEATKPGDQRIYNVGTGVGVSVNRLIDTISAVTGQPVPLKYRPARDEPKVLVSESNKIQSELGWKPLISDLNSIVRDGWSSLQRTSSKKAATAQDFND